MIRKRCCYCVVKHPTDGLGPILPHELVSDGMCPAAFAIEMDKLDQLGAPK